LAQTAEGTPSFESVNIKDHDLDRSEIKMRFHYFKDGNVDQQAIGTLSGFFDWKTEPLVRINSNLLDMGYNGNLGSRSRFQMNNTDYYLIESQITKNLWNSFRIVLTKGVSTPLWQLDFNLPDKYKDWKSFANPKITKLKKPDGSELFLISIFVHGHGEIMY